MVLHAAAAGSPMTSSVARSVGTVCFARELPTQLTVLVWPHETGHVTGLLPSAERGLGERQLLR